MMKKLILFCLAIFMPLAARAMANRMPPVYGVPTLYGEYEISADDVKRAGQMYGDAPVVRAGAVRPIRMDAPADKKVAAKHVKKQQKVTKKKSNKKASKKSNKSVRVAQKKKVVENVPGAEKTEKVQVASKTVAPEQPKVAAPAVPRAVASDIASRAKYKIDLDAYCVPTGIVATGNMPDGFVLMPGRPDLMSCVPEKQKK